MREIYNLETVCRRCKENTCSTCELYYLRKKLDLKIIEEDDIQFNESLRKKIERYNADNFPEVSSQDIPDQFSFESTVNPVTSGQPYRAERDEDHYQVIFPGIGVIAKISMTRMKDNIFKGRFILVEDEDKE